MQLVANDELAAARWRPPSTSGRGWEHLTAEQLGDDCAEPGGYLAGSYSRGWQLVLELFAGSLGPAPNREEQS